MDLYNGNIFSLQWDVCRYLHPQSVALLSVRREIIDPAFPPPIHHKRKWDIPSAGLGHRGNGTIYLWNNKRRSSQQWLLLVLAMFKKWAWNVKTPFSSPSFKECPYSLSSSLHNDFLPFIGQITAEQVLYFKSTSTKLYEHIKTDFIANITI